MNVDLRAQFAIEMQVLARLDHPNIVKILGFSVAGAGLVLGVSTLAAAEASTLDGCATPVECTDISDRANALGSTSVWAFVGTGVAAGVSIGLLTWSLGGPSAKPSGSATTFQIVPNLGGAKLRGTF